MAGAGMVVVDGKRTAIHYHTGTVTAGRKKKVDHRALVVVDAMGRARAFNVVDLDIAVREGHTVTVVWIEPENVEAGPPIEIYNHDTGDRTVATPRRIVSYFAKPKALVSATTVAAVIAAAWLFWPLALAAAGAPYFYFKWRAQNAVKRMLASPELERLEAELAHVKPAATPAAA